MLADIHAATDSVYLCTYIFQHDQIGRQFISSLVAAQSRGVDIKVLVDGLGALAYPPRAGKALLDAGLPLCSLRSYTPVPALTSYQPPQP